MNNSIIQNKLNNKKNNPMPIIIVITFSILLLVGPSVVNMSVFAQGNTANQAISQAQSSTQLGVCVSGTGTLISCNNLNAQNQANSGNNALAQSGGSGSGKGGNTANQGIGQSQTSNQNAQCVSGKDAIVSCDNESFQNQVNSGNNVLGQQ